MSLFPIVFQQLEDDPRKPGSWRWGRPEFRELPELPPITSSSWWYIGDASRAAEDAAKWDASHC